MTGLLNPKALTQNKWLEYYYFFEFSFYDPGPYDCLSDMLEDHVHGVA